MRKTPDKRVNSTPNLGSRASQILQNLLFATSALAATACDNPDSRSENEGDNLSTITSPLVLQAAPRNIEGLPANPVSVNFISINGVNYAFVIVDDPRFPGVPEGLFELYREVDGRFERSQIIGFDEGRAFAEEIMFLQGEAGFGRFMMRSGGALYMFESFVNDQGNIQIVDPNGSPVLDPENPGVGLGFSDIKVISNSRDFLARSGSTLYIINSIGIARVLGEVTPQIANHLFSKGLPSIRLNADNTMSFAIPGAADQRTGRTEIRINDVAAGTSIIDGITEVLLNGEPLVFANHNIEAQDPQFALGDSNEMTFISFDGAVQVVTLGDPVIPPVDAAIQDAAPEDAGVDAAVEQDAATPDAEAVDAEVSPADSGPDAEVSQPDAALADMSVSPDMNQSDAEPDGGMSLDMATPNDSGVDMSADAAGDQGEPAPEVFAPDCNPEETHWTLDAIEDYLEQVTTENVFNARYCETLDGLLRFEIDPTDGQAQTINVELNNGGEFTLTFFLEGNQKLNFLMDANDSDFRPIAAGTNKIAVREEGVQVQHVVDIPGLEGDVILGQEASARAVAEVIGESGNRVLRITGFGEGQNIEGDGRIVYSVGNGSKIIFEFKGGQPMVEFPFDEIIAKAKQGITPAPPIEPDPEPEARIVGGASIFKDCSTAPGQSPEKLEFIIAMLAGGIVLVRRRLSRGKPNKI